MLTDRLIGGEIEEEHEPVGQPVGGEIEEEHEPVRQTEIEEEPAIVGGVDDREVTKNCTEVQNAISSGAISFLLNKYKYLIIFTVLFSLIIFLLLGSAKAFNTKSEPCTYRKGNNCKPALAVAVSSCIAFLLGASTSALSVFLAIRIVTHADVSTKATIKARTSIGQAFIVAFRSGEVVGFFFAAIGLFVLYILVLLFELYYRDDWEGLYGSITGYALGSSMVALFGSVGGGIYAQAASIGAYCIGIEQSIPKDDPRNPAVIADKVGDIIEDIIGMSSDVLGSYAESSCAALFVALISSFATRHDYVAMSYPIMVSSMGIVVCLLTAISATDLSEIQNVDEIEPNLIQQLLMSTILITIGIGILNFFILPSKFTLLNFGTEKTVKNWYLFLCVMSGMFSRLLVGFFTAYCTSNAYRPVQDMAEYCKTGVEANVIFGLALGYMFVIIPMFAIAFAFYVSFSLARMYGIAVAASAMVSTIAIDLAIIAYGTICHNAAHIARMAKMNNMILETTSALDAARNTTVAIGKGFTIVSAALVSLASFGAFMCRANITTIDVLTKNGFLGLIAGAMLPYCLSAMTVESVVSVALEVVNVAREHFKENAGLMDGTREPEYATFVQISTTRSLRKMIPPSTLVMLTPLIVGTLFGVETLAGVLAGSFIYGIQVVVSASTTGRAWENTKKYIEARASDFGPMGSGPHRAAVIGQTVGGPLKDTLGPSLNILIKFMAVESLVFAPFFVAHGGLLFKLQ